MKKLFQLVLVTSLSLLCFSCYYDELIERPIDAPPGGGEPEEEISYINEIQPIWNLNCIGCHPNQSEPDLRPDNSYNALVPDYVTPGSPSSSELYKKLPGNSHPIDVGFELSDEDMALIYYWIEQGAKDN